MRLAGITTDIPGLRLSALPYHRLMSASACSKPRRGLVAEVANSSWANVQYVDTIKSPVVTLFDSCRRYSLLCAISCVGYAVDVEELVETKRA